MTALPPFGKPPEKPQPLPQFRQDLRIFPGPSEPDGSPTYNLFDPVRGQYFKVTWTESLVFQLLRPGMTVEDLIKAIENHSTLRVDKEELDRFFREAFASHLLAVPRKSEDILKEAERVKTGWFMWFIFHYLYIRIPLFNPDKFLERTIDYVKPLFSPLARFIYLVLIVGGLLQLISRWEEYLHTFTYFFNASGIVAYGLAIICVKVIHEFSHAYTAKYFHTRVPAIGIALIVFWPVAYTDVTDSWKLAKRRQRIGISGAGIIAELIVAGIATLGWALSEPGMFQSMCFVVSSTTWISTLVVNLNPALRFDGYYLLCDLWGIDNLQPRSFAITRWQLRKWLLGLDVAPPEEIPTRRRIWMVIYAVYTWTYRVFLYTAIAVFIYFKFTKVLGIFLFILEIAVFILWPLGSEISQLYRMRDLFTINRRLLTTCWAFALLLFWLFVPLPHRDSFSAISVPSEESSQVIYVPIDSSIEKLYVKRGDRVVPGQPLLMLRSFPLEIAIAEGNIEKQMAETALLIAGEEEENRPLVAQKKAEIKEVDEGLQGLHRLHDQLLIRATAAGTLYSWDETLIEKQALSKNQVLGKIADLNRIDVAAFVPESHIRDLHTDQTVSFRPYSTHESFPGKIFEINPTRNPILAYPQLASVNRGDLPVVEEPKNKRLHLVESYYQVTARVENIPTRPLEIGETGSLEIYGPWRSLAMDLWRAFVSLLWREGSI